MTRRQYEDLMEIIARLERELADQRTRIEILLEMFLCKTCDGEGMVPDEEYDSGFATCIQCDGNGYTNRVGKK